MPFKTILAVLGIPQTDRDLQTAADISNQVRAHLSVFIVGFAPQPTSRYATLASTWFEQRDWNLKALGETATTVRDKLSKREISFEVDSIYAEVAGATYDIGERALYSDLILMGPDAFQNADLKQQIITGGLIQSERPVLLIPPGPIPTLHPKTVLLAWDSRAQSANAAREALQLLSNAKSVHVAMVDPTATPRQSGDEPGADVATYLARHGIDVTVDALPSAGRTVAQVLQRHANDVAADMIVMGAYGHSRLRELVFGGVTRSMLDEARLPVLMAR
ncbi:universal stress protein [Sinorhizobium medicae]|uniref:universal stress protein n=1 Tax=Sinorhizobium medicae TaxID=110321 RepID=UPI000C7D2364|nr:universal stress protein [Sinorhizobium medicae]PLU41275.1 universal stress protein [Sinorhizobium medicae]RVH89068.1 universal stress protein [Sinorhizobium medicae]RVJ79263.1 universal stress protein [Sinorhizobium medicae]RVK16359.1 universal stress protein [Sinorhizobium medicae]RVP68254.1 universal stress protein [Sinorhizobium medicae]